MRIPSMISSNVAAMVAFGLLLTPSTMRSAWSDTVESGFLLSEGKSNVTQNSEMRVLASSDTAHTGHAIPKTIPHERRKSHQVKFDPISAKTEFELKPVNGGDIVAGEKVRVILRINDATSGLPVSGRNVTGWMMLRRNSHVAAEMACKTKARLFTQGLVTARPDVNLNASKLMILNREGTIGFANPQVDFTITQLESIIPLPGVPADWIMAADQQTLFVSLPVYGAVAVIDTRRAEITKLIEVGKGTLPTLLEPLPDGRVAVFLSGIKSVTITGTEDRKEPVSILVGDGPVAMEAAHNGTLYAASADGNVVAIDSKTLKVIASARIPSGSPSLAWSSNRNHLYAATSNSHEIAVLNTLSLETLEHISVAPGIFTMAMTPGGQQLLALNRATSKLLLIDTATNTSNGQETVARAPVEISFSHDYAYIRGLEGDHFSVVELAELRAGRIVPVHVQSAARPIMKREALERAKLIAPYGHGALVGNVDEGVAYYYMEGMNSAMGTVKTYGPNVQGLMTTDQGFRETAPGVYETIAVLPHGGAYDIPVVIDSDALVTCFTAVVKPGSRSATARAQPSIRVDPDLQSGMAAKVPGKVFFKIIDAETNQPVTGLTDVRMLAFSSSGTWQARKWAVEMEGGEYVSEWTFPKAGRYALSVAVASRNLSFADQPPVYLHVGAPDAGMAPRKGNEP